MDEKGIVLLDVRWIRGSNMDGKGDSYIKVCSLKIFIIFCIFHDLRVTFFPVSRIFDNEDDIFIFSRNVRNSSASEN